jgi:hypothetical protein
VIVDFETIRTFNGEVDIFEGTDGNWHILLCESGPDGFAAQVTLTPEHVEVLHLILTQIKNATPAQGQE